MIDTHVHLWSLDLAEKSNVTCKLSGLLTDRRADAPAKSVEPYISELLSLFNAFITLPRQDSDDA